MSKGGTVLVVDTGVPSFDAYIKSLSKHARKDYAYVKKHNADLTYEEVPFHKPDVERFMAIWGEQIIHGNEPVRWGFDICYVQEMDRRGVVRVFQAKLGDEIIAMHFIEKHDGYVEAHPPMYDKKHSKRYLAKYMWFSLIKWAIGNDTKFVDLGSGDRGTWKELVKNRKKYPRIAYKWMYISDKVKKNPNKEKDYLVYNEYGHKWISETN